MFFLNIIGQHQIKLCLVTFKSFELSCPSYLIYIFQPNTSDHTNDASLKCAIASLFSAYKFVDADRYVDSRIKICSNYHYHSSNNSSKNLSSTPKEAIRTLFMIFLCFQSLLQLFPLCRSPKELRSNMFIFVS